MTRPTTVGRAVLFGLKAAFTAAAVLIVACSRAPSTEPQNNAPARYLGSAACAACHANEFAEWQGSHHQLAMQVASADSVIGDFGNVTFDYFGEQTEFLTDGDRYRVRTANARGTIEEFDVAYAFGVEPLQQYLVEFPGGRLQALPFIWDARDADLGGQRWHHLYGNDYVAPDDLLHWTGAQQNWNFMCAECHSTNVVMGFDAQTDTFATTYSEISVGCEACHGPGSIHVDQAENDAFKNSRRGLQVDLDDRGRAVWVINPDTGIAERSEPRMQVTRQPEACGRCHARRGVITEHYEFGRPLADTHNLSLLDEHLYFADGQIQDEVYVYGSFLQSRMYRAGVSCSDCHNPHTLALVSGDEPNDVCSQCHLPSKFLTRDHSGHADSVVGCVDCHMTARTYMQVDDRRDHSFRVPRPDLTDTTGAPSACNACHAEQTSEWAAAAVAAWHGEAQRPEFATALAAGRKGGANTALIAAFNDPSTPGIARATALTLLESPLQAAEADAINAGLRDPDPLVRIAALRTHRFMPPEFRLQAGMELLGDEVRSVRIAAVLAYANLRDELSARARQDFHSAAADYRESQRIILNRPEAHVGLGDFEFAFGNTEDAFAHYEQALAIEPRYVLARVNFADALRLVGDDARGRQVLEEGIRRQPSSAALHHSLGLLLVRVGEPKGALEALREAVRLESGNQRYRYVLDIAESELGNTVPN